VRQLDGVEVAKTFTDRASGKDSKRPQLEEMIAFVREGDTVVIHSMDVINEHMSFFLKLVVLLPSALCRGPGQQRKVAEWGAAGWGSGKECNGFAARGRALPYLKKEYRSRMAFSL